MYTSFPYEGRIDYKAYLEAYFQQPDALRSIPSDEELDDLARKSIIRDQLILAPLPEGEAAQAGDTATLRTVSTLPRFNKEKVIVSLGRGLYNKELEDALISCKAGDTVSLNIQDQNVMVTVLELKRKQVPEPTDAMVEELQAKDMKNQPIHTVADYIAFIHEQKTMEALVNINYYTMEKIMADYPIKEYSEEDIKILGDLERVYFIELFLKEEGYDLRERIPDSWKEGGINNFDEFIQVRREWYQSKIHQCLIFLNILGLPCEGKTDPLDHYEVLQELQMKVFDLLKKEMKRRNGA